MRDLSEHQALQEDVLRIASLEQRRIGQELHDATQQELTGLGLMAQSLAERLRRTNNNEALTMAARLAKGIERANQNVQFLARGLVPTTIDRRSLMTVLAELVANSNCAGDFPAASSALSRYSSTTTRRRLIFFVLRRRRSATPLSMRTPNHS